MAYHEPQYIELDENEDFKIDAHVDSDGYQRFEVMGYLVRHRNGATYRTPIIPEMFYGENGEQLDTWRQYLTAGDHTILRRDSGNPHVPDHDLNWQLVSQAPQRSQVQPMQPTAVSSAIDTNTILLIIAGLAGVGLLYYLIKR